MMGVIDQDKTDKIIQFLKWHPRGMTISDLSVKIDMNRNLVAKYLDMLLISGQVEMQNIGTAKVYFLSNRVPISGILEYSSDLVFVLDRNTIIKKVNERALSVLCLRREDLIGRRLEESGNPFLMSLPEIPVRLENNSIKELTYEIARQVKGNLLYFRIKTIPTTLEDASHGTTLLIEDITDQRRYQEILERSESQYRGIVEDQTDFIIRFLPDGTLIFANAAYARYLGISPEDLIGRRCFDHLLPEDQPDVGGSLAAITRENQVRTIEFRLSAGNGTTRWNEWKIRGLFNDAGQLREYQGVGQDITEKHSAAEKINAYIRGMEFLSRTAMAFIDMDDDEDLYRFITEQIHAFDPDLIVGANSFDIARGAVTLRSISGLDEQTAQQFQDWGVSLIGMSFPLANDLTAEEIVSRKCLSLGPDRLYKLLFRTIPEPVCERIERLIGWGCCYAMGCVCQGEIFGSIVLIVKKGNSLRNREIIEAFINQAGFALHHRTTRHTIYPEKTS